MWRKNYFNWSGMLIFCAMLVSCSKSPDKLVGKYLDYTFLDTNGEKAYELLSSEDQQYIAQKEFANRLKRENLLNKRILEKYEEYFFYDIVDVSTPADTVFVTVQLHKPNAINVLGDLVEYAMSTVFSSLTENQQASAISRKFESIMMSKDRLLVTERKTYTVIKESEGYKIFLDLGFPEKQKRKQEHVAHIKQQALLKEDNWEFNAALAMYNQVLLVSFDQEAADRKAKLENRIARTLHLGQSKVFGNLKFKPIHFEKRRARIKRNPRGMPAYFEPTMNEYLILTFEAQNISEGQVFAIEDEMPFNAKSVITDNFGNSMKELLPEVYTDQIEGMVFKQLQPGEKHVFKIACDVPLNNRAKEFIWSINLQTDNKGNKATAYVLFNKETIKTELKLAHR